MNTIYIVLSSFARSSRTLTLRKASTASVLALLFTSGSTFGQQTPSNPPSNPPAKENEVLELDKLVVEGSMLGQAKALQGTKEAVNLINIISSDKMGTFPDLNAAEALGRLPGVSVIQEAGEGRFVSIRGARPQYNGTLVNGFSLPSADSETRRNDLVTISNALIDTIVVTKAAMPDLPSDGIGGVANIIMRNPLDLRERTITASAFYGKNELGNGQDRETASYGDFIGKNQKFAFLVSVNRRKSDSFYDETEANEPSLVNGSGGSQVWLIPQFRYQRTEAVRRNQGIDLAVGAKLGFNTEIVLRGFHSYGLQDQNIYRYTYSGFAPYTVGGNVVDLTQNGGLVNGRVVGLYRMRTWRLEVKGWQMTGETEINKGLKLDYGFSSSRSFEKYLTDFYFNGVRVNSYGEPARLLQGTETYKLLPTGASSNNFLRNAASQVIANNVDAPERKDWESERTPYLNVTKTLDLKDGGSLQFKAGTYLRFKQKANPSTAYVRTQTGSLTFANLGNAGAFDDFDQKGIILPNMFSPDTSRGLVAANPTSFAAPVPSILPGGVLMYTAHEDIYAGYAMATYTKDRLTLIAGGRYEKTDEEFKRLTAATNGFYKEFTDDYQHFMPSVHVKYALQKDMFLRASWTNTVARPDAINIYSTETTDPVNFTIFSPNPGLKSLTSNNFDASFDWYTGTLGQFMVGAFTKDIKNFPFTVTDRVVIGGNNYTRTSVQANTDGWIRGWEASFRRNFDFLPGPLGGLGLDVNYCKLDSEIESPLRPDHPNLEQQPEDIFNISLIYAFKGLFVRLAMSHTGEEIESTSDTPGGDEIDSERKLWDLTASYDFGRDKSYQIYAEWRNITNEPTLSHWRASGILAHKWNSGASFGGGFRLRF